MKDRSLKRRVRTENMLLLKKSLMTKENIPVVLSAEMKPVSLCKGPVP